MKKTNLDPIVTPPSSVDSLSLAHGAREAKAAARVAAAQLRTQQADREHALYEAEKAARKREKAEAKARERAEAEAEAQRLKADREGAKAEQAKHKEDLKARVKQYRDNKKAKRADEKKRKAWLGGVSWGFDPTAGMTAGNGEDSETRGTYIHGGRIRDQTEAAVDQLDELSRRTGKRWEQGTTWGLERGGPGKEGKCGHGSLKGKEPVKLPEVDGYVGGRRDSSLGTRVMQSGKAKWPRLPERSSQE